jgi:hypothetical protein
MTVASENSMLKHRNVDLNAVSLKASDCTYKVYYYSYIPRICERVFNVLKRDEWYE